MLPDQAAEAAKRDWQPVGQQAEQQRTLVLRKQTFPRRYLVRVLVSLFNQAALDSQGPQSS